MKEESVGSHTQEEEHGFFTQNMKSQTKKDRICNILILSTCLLFAGYYALADTNQKLRKSRSFD